MVRSRKAAYSWNPALGCVGKLKAAEGAHRAVLDSIQGRGLERIEGDGRRQEIDALELPTPPGQFFDQEGVNDGTGGMANQVKTDLIRREPRQPSVLGVAGPGSSSVHNSYKLRRHITKVIIRTCP